MTTTIEEILRLCPIKIAAASTFVQAAEQSCTFLSRPENTHKGSSSGHQANLNLLYWSKEGKAIQVFFQIPILVGF